MSIAYPDDGSGDGTDIDSARRVWRPSRKRHCHCGPFILVPFVGSDAFLPHLWRLLGAPGVFAELRFCRPLATSHATRNGLAREAHLQIAGAWEEAPQSRLQPVP